MERKQEDNLELLSALMIKMLSFQNKTKSNYNFPKNKNRKT